LDEIAGAINEGKAVGVAARGREAARTIVGVGASNARGVAYGGNLSSA
jgi:hypothetical protein